MKKSLFAGAAAATLIAGAAAVAQTSAPAPAAQAPGAQSPAAGTVHTRATVQQAVAQHFTRLDTNRDGFVTKAEADAVRAARAGKRGDRAAKRAGGAHDGGAMFERLDANSDGMISRAEFDAHHAQRQQRITARAPDGDGRRDAHRMHGGGGFGSFSGPMFEMADANRDGRVTLQEATDAALRHFDMADANRDGQITSEERRQMHQRMRAERPTG